MMTVLLRKKSLKLSCLPIDKKLLPGVMNLSWVNLMAILLYNREIQIHRFIQDFIKKKNRKFINDKD